MRENYLLSTDRARRLYETVKDCPIYDYHCHLSPKEIWEDKPFDNIGEMWLGGDHYKWRLMRAAGIPEEEITGEAGWHKKFLAYAKALSTAAGNPLYHWSAMELHTYFDVDIPLSPETAEEIWEKANCQLRAGRLSPRRLIEKSGVAFIATTDDVADSLEYHHRLAGDPSLQGVRITPSFRADNVWLLQREGYGAYIEKLSAAAGVAINDMASLQKALCRRLDAFEAAGCRFSDVGIPAFPSGWQSAQGAGRAFEAALAGEAVEPPDYDAFLWEMYVFLGREYQKRHIAMQLHLAVQRNVNTPLFRDKGGDCGGDCMGDAVPGRSIVRLLDAIHRGGGLPETILYTLQPSMLPQLCSIAGSFPHVRVGAAWWFNDHKRGIAETIQTIAEIHHIGSFLGMLTDSRSFLSYVRHDYFRRILCDILANWEESGEFAGDTEALARAICYGNVKQLVEEIK